MMASLQVADASSSRARRSPERGRASASRARGSRSRACSEFGAAAERVRRRRGARRCARIPKSDKLRLVTVVRRRAPSKRSCAARRTCPAPGGRVRARAARRDAAGRHRDRRARARRRRVATACCAARTSSASAATTTASSCSPPRSRSRARHARGDALGLRDTVFEIGADAEPRRTASGTSGSRASCARCSTAVRAAAAAGSPRAVARPPSCPQGDAPVRARARRGARTRQRSSRARRHRRRRALPALRRGARRSACAIGASPFWLRYRLHVLGLRAICNVVDVTNLVMLAWGHPMHAFDLDRVRGGAHRGAPRARGRDACTTLDGVERTLVRRRSADLRRRRPGRARRRDGRRRLSEIQRRHPARAVRVRLLRSALRASHARRTACTPTRAIASSAASIPAARARVLAHARRADRGARRRRRPSPSALDVVAQPIAPRASRCVRARVDALLGVRASRASSRALADRRRLRGRAPRASGFDVRAPTHRPDLSREVDLIEELARVQRLRHAAERAAAHRALGRGHAASRSRFVRRLRETAAAAGLNEAVNYAFVAPTRPAAPRARPRTRCAWSTRCPKSAR